MPEVTAKIFRNGRSQAIRIPAAFRFETDTVILEKQGDTLIVRPLPTPGWDRFFADESLVLPEDFDTGVDAPPPERKLF